VSCAWDASGKPQAHKTMVPIPMHQPSRKQNRRKMLSFLTAQSQLILDGIISV